MPHVGTSENAYATLTDYKNYVTARNQTPSTGDTDDDVIEMLLDAASRYIDNETQRIFYPMVQTRYFDVPEGRELDVDEDLLEVLSITNGGASLASSEYNLVPRNYSPAYGIKITDVSSYAWTSNAAGSMEQAIVVNGVWGYHDKYSQAWGNSITITEDLDTSETAVDVSSHTIFSAGHIIRIDNELMLITGVASSITVVRGWNGSTAVAHSNGTSIEIWHAMHGAKQACLEIAQATYHRRFGKSLSNTETVTAAGVVLTPRDIPRSAAAFISTFRDRL